MPDGSEKSGDLPAEPEENKRTTEIHSRAWGFDAQLYKGRRIAMQQFQLHLAAVIGQRRHATQWTMIFVLSGQVEIKLYEVNRAYPFTGIVLTTASDPLVLRHSVGYEITGLMDSSLVVVHGTYNEMHEVDPTDVVQCAPDLSASEAQAEQA